MCLGTVSSQPSAHQLLTASPPTREPPAGRRKARFLRGLARFSPFVSCSSPPCPRDDPTLTCALGLKPPWTTGRDGRGQEQPLPFPLSSLSLLPGPPRGCESLLSQPSLLLPVLSLTTVCCPSLGSWCFLFVFVSFCFSFFLFFFSSGGGRRGRRESKILS